MAGPDSKSDFCYPINEAIGIIAKRFSAKQAKYLAKDLPPAFYLCARWNRLDPWNNFCHDGRVPAGGENPQQILVIDDEEPLCELLSAFLTKRGYSTSAVACAKDALDFLKEHEPDLIILDLALPDADGLELLGILKRERPNIRIIVLTGMGFDEELLQESRRKGADGYLSKMLPLDQLLMAVHRALKFRKTTLRG